MKRSILIGIIFFLIIPCCKKTPTTPEILEVIINSFLADPTEIVQGEETTLKWSVSNANKIELSAPDFTTQDVTTLSETNVSPEVTTVFTLTAINDAGRKTATCEVKVNWEWNPVGSWELLIDHSGWGDITETIELTGIDQGGTVTGWARGNQQSTAGTWVQTGDFSIRITMDYWVAPNNTGAQHTVNLTCNSSEASPNSMSGSGTWRYQAFFDITYGVDFTATKTSNQQTNLPDIGIF